MDREELEQRKDPGIEVDFSATNLNVEITADYTDINFGYDINPSVDFSNVDFSDFDLNEMISDIEFNVDIDTYVNIHVDTNITEMSADIEFTVENIGGSFSINEGVNFTQPEVGLTVEFTIPVGNK